MNDNVFNSLNNLIYENQIGNLPTLVSQIGSVHSVSAMAKKLMEIECSPSLSAIEKSLSRYDDILKPLHMSGMSAIERAMSVSDRLWNMRMTLCSKCRWQQRFLR